jgi:hypothetical protein
VRALRTRSGGCARASRVRNETMPLTPALIAIAGTGYGLIGILIVIVLVLIIVRLL